MECSIFNSRYAIGNSYTCKARATEECHYSNFSYIAIECEYSTLLLSIVIV